MQVKLSPSGVDVGAREQCVTQDERHGGAGGDAVVADAEELTGDVSMTTGDAGEEVGVHPGDEAVDREQCWGWVDAQPSLGSALETPETCFSVKMADPASIVLRH